MTGCIVEITRGNMHFLQTTLYALITYIRCKFQHHHSITPNGLAEAKDKAYIASRFWFNYHADICEYCYDGVIVVPKRKMK